MFDKILVANRGEIACRVIRTARRMGLATVAVYSEADRAALHARLADEAVCIGAAPLAESYLSIEKMLAACRQAGAQAVHPGYGFLSENAAFARRVEAAGLCFIGPGHEAIAAMGDKIEARRIARAAGVSVIPGGGAPVASPEEALGMAAEIGYPVMIKAVAGGGGKGLRVVFDEAQAREAYEACRREAGGAFGDDRVFVEKFITRPRHIEVQVLADAHGHCVTLFERECSIQRRHQKLIEEAPSPFVDAPMREAMSAQAVALARAVQYRSVGTVEFVVSPDRSFHFLEMNTRLQVEHPVTECVTGLDLVEQMIRVAAGEPLAFTQEALSLNGWAVECRINAEDPLRDFLPSSGRLTVFRPPAGQPGVRVDTGVFEGGQIPVFYDSLVAKLIARGGTRAEALQRMSDALDALVLRGVRSNTAFLSAVLNHPRFREGKFDTQFIAEIFPGGFDNRLVCYDDPVRLVVLAGFIHQRRVLRRARIEGAGRVRAYQPPREWTVRVGETAYLVRLEEIAGGFAVACEGRLYRIRSDWSPGQPLLRADMDGLPVCVRLECRDETIALEHRGYLLSAQVLASRVAALLEHMPREAETARAAVLRSPMPGVVRELAVQEDDPVTEGQKLAVIEAMKMENVLRAEGDGRVRSIAVREGDRVAVDEVLIEFY